MPAMLRLRLRLIAMCVAVCALAPLLVAPAASAAGKDCGKAIIDEYFFSGRIKYHSQACYASALKQIDPDARMYSGIMGAIRAARARDRAADTRATSGGASGTASGGTASAGDAGDGGVVPEVVPDNSAPPDALPVETLPVEAPADEAGAPEAREGDDATIVAAGEAAPTVPTIGSQLPLPVFLLMALAGVVTLVGLGGLTVRWLDGSR